MAEPVQLRAAVPPPPQSPPSIWALARYFLRLGATGFGGPVALANAMRRDLVEARRWLSDAEYDDGLAIAAACPGPLAYQLGVYCGYIRHGVAGGLAAAAAFALPPYLLVTAAIAAVGADSEDKQELEPELLAAAAVVPDSLQQAAAIGELHWALAQGLMTPAQVRAELPEIVAGQRPGRSSPEEITIFDSTGTALQDVAAAVVVLENARRGGRGTPLDLAGAGSQASGGRALQAPDAASAQSGSSREML